MPASNMEIGRAINALREACAVVNTMVRAAHSTGCGVHLNLNHKCTVNGDGTSTYLPEVSMIIALPDTAAAGA